MSDRQPPRDDSGDKTIVFRGLDEAWQVVLDKCEEIKKTYLPALHGTNRDIARVSTDGRSISTVLQIDLADGTSDVYFITAHVPWAGVGVRAKRHEVRVKRFTYDHGEYWESQITSEPDRRVVIDNVHYRLGKNGSRRGPYNGFGGRRFDIEFFDGRVVTTYDLWHQGVVPPSFRDRLPDNARWAVPASAPDIAIPLRFEP
jgi:hypothetical protein